MTAPSKTDGSQWRRSLYRLLHKRPQDLQRIKTPTPPTATRKTTLSQHFRKLSSQLSLSPKQEPHRHSDLTNINGVYRRHKTPPSSNSSPSSNRFKRALHRRVKTLHIEASRFKLEESPSISHRKLPPPLPSSPSSPMPPLRRPRTARSSSAASYFARRLRRRRTTLVNPACEETSCGSPNIRVSGTNEHIYHLHPQITLSEVLRCSHKRKYFESFLKKELSDENLKFLIACDAFSETVDRLIEEKSPSKLKARNMILGLANELSDNFLSDHANTPVNVSYHVKRPIQNTLNAWSMYLRLERVRHLEEKYAHKTDLLRDIVEQERELSVWHLIDQQFLDDDSIINRPSHTRSISEPSDAYSPTRRSIQRASTDISGQLPHAIRTAMFPLDEDDLSVNERSRSGEPEVSFWDFVDTLNSGQQDTEESKRDIKPQGDEGFLLPVGGFSWIEYSEKVHQQMKNTQKYKSKNIVQNEFAQEIKQEIERRLSSEDMLGVMLKKERLRIMKEQEGLNNHILSEEKDSNEDEEEEEEEEEEESETPTDHYALSWRLYGLFDSAYREVFQLLNHDAFKRFINTMELERTNK